MTAEPFPPLPEPKPPACQDCSYVQRSQPGGPANHGPIEYACHRYPPVVLSELTEQLPRARWGWPQVAATSWCGEFE